MFIYGLVDPRDNEIRYVGKTNNPKVRFLNHSHGSKFNVIGKLLRYRLGVKTATEKELWLYELRAEGLAPQLTILEICTPENVDERERFWIDYLSRGGRYLTNTKYLKGDSELGPLQKKYGEIDVDNG